MNRDQLGTVDGRGLDWFRRAANAINWLLRQIDRVEALELAIMERDTDGGPVPVWLAHAFTYDGSGNLQTETITDGADSWVRTLTYSGGNLVLDSRWVKQ